MTATCITELSRAPGSFQAILGGVFDFSVSSESDSIFVHFRPYFYRLLTTPKREKLALAPPGVPQRHFRPRCKNPDKVRVL